MNQDQQPLTYKGVSAEDVLKKYNNCEWNSEGDPVYCWDCVLKAMEEYRLQSEGWISVEDELPEIGKQVIIITEFENIQSGNKVAECETFIGYMGEQGELFSLPLEDDYGWTFKECVTHWRYLPNPPQK